MVPLYQMFAGISHVPFIGIDTLSAVMLPTITTAFLIFFFRQSTKMFPRNCLKQAELTDCNELGLFFRIYRAYDEDNICCSRYYYVHVELEQLLVAAHRAAIAGETNNSNVDLQSGLQLFTGLWHDHDGNRHFDDSDCACILPDAEAFCSRYDRFGKITKESRDDAKMQLPDL